MKFICENCKAKYQIGDDKIAGRSVRMKCRRCGHLIQLSASVTEASSGDGPGHDVVDTSLVETGSSASLSVSALLGGAHAHEAAASQLREEPEEDPTRAMTREQRAALGVRDSQAGPPTQQAVRASAPQATPGPAAARPGFGAPAGAALGAPRAGAAPGATALGAARPGAGAPLGGVARGAPVAPAAARPAAGSPGGAAIRPGPSAGVAGAFQKTLAEGTAPSDAPKPTSSGAHVPHGEDWYVGVGGVPLGPVRLAVIREKALAGSVQAESLVWREGFDEWQPLKNFPELLEIVEEAQVARSGGRRPSAVPRAPTPAPPPVSAPKPAGITAPSPYQAKVPAPGPAPFQPKATAVGVGIPAVTLPGAKAPLASSTTPGAPLGARPAAGHPHAPAAHAPAPHAPAAHAPAAHTPAPHAPAGIAPRDLRASVPHAPGALGRAAIVPPGPTGRSSSVPVEPARPSNLGQRPGDAGAAPAGFGLRPEAPAPHSSTVVSPSHAPTPAPAPVDLFGGVSAPPAVIEPPAPTPVPSEDPLAKAVAASAAALDVMRDPFAAPASAAPAAEGRAVSGGAARAASELALRPSAPVIESPLSGPVVAPPASEAPLSIAGLGGSRRRGGMHPIVYAFIAMAGAFGIVAAYLIFARPPQQVIVYQPMPGTPSGAPAPGTAGADTATAPAPPPEVGTAEPSSGQPRVTGGGPAGTGGGPKPTSSGTSAPLDTSGFGNQVVPPPVATPTNTTADPSLGQLSAGEIQGVVASNQARVRKRCWQPALDSAGSNVSPNARVQGRIVIGPSGSVDSASASGAEKDFPGLSSCIAGQMKGWKFPPSGGSTPVNVPFVFAGQ